MQTLKPVKLQLLVLLLCTLLFASCNEAPAPSFHMTIPTQAALHRFDLSARQGLRDPLNDLATRRKTGADTHIVVGSGTKVEIFASGQANVKGDGSQLGPAGTTSCANKTLPQPNLPCYAVLYSIGMSSPAATVGNHVEFIAPQDGNIFLGINAPNLTANSGAYHITVVTIPRGTAIGLWNTPDTSFLIQGTSVTLAMQAFALNNPIDSVEFTASMPGQAATTICEITKASANNTYTCRWDLAFRNGFLHNGTLSFGFNIRTQTGNLLTNPDGTRSGTARYVFTERSDIYAGYDAGNFNQPATNNAVKATWTVAAAHCSFGENSLSAVWVGLSSRSSDNSLLAQTGITIGCENGVPQYQGWWEMYPSPSVTLNQTILPNDTITAGTTYSGGAFVLTLDDVQRGWHFSTTQTGGRASDTRFALCVVEAPSLIDPTTNQATVASLTNFGSINVTCQVNGQPLGNGPQNDIFQMASGGIPKATTSPLDSTGSQFTVQWQHT